MLRERLQKFLRRVAVGGAERALLDLVQADEVDMAGPPPQERGKRKGVRLVRVLPFDEAVFK